MGALGDAGLVSADLVDHCRLMTRVLVGSRLLAPDLAVPANGAAAVLARQTGMADSEALLRALTAARRAVARDWTTAFGQTLEMDDD